jgi:hypothetical protein
MKTALLRWLSRFVTLFIVIGLAGCREDLRIGDTNFFLRAIGRNAELRPERIALGIKKDGRFREVWPAIYVQVGVADAGEEVLFGSETPERELALFGVNAEGIVVDLSNKFGARMVIMSISTRNQELALTFRDSSVGSPKKMIVTKAQVRAAIRHVIDDGDPVEWMGFQYRKVGVEPNISGRDN